MQVPIAKGERKAGVDSNGNNIRTRTPRTKATKENLRTTYSKDTANIIGAIRELTRGNGN